MAKIIDKIVESSTAPSKNNLWLNDGKLKANLKGKWESIGGGINDETPIKETLTGEELVPIYDGENKATTVTELVKGGKEVIIIKHSELTKELFDKYIQEIFNGKIAYFSFDKNEAYNEDHSYPLGAICPVMLDTTLNGDGTLNTYMTNIVIYQKEYFYTLKYNDEERLYKSNYYNEVDILESVPSEILSRNFRDFTKEFPTPEKKPFFIYDDKTNTGSHFAHCYDTENVKFWVTALNKYIFGYALFKGGNGYVRWCLDLTEDIFNTYDNNAALFNIWEPYSSTFNGNKYKNQLLVELIKYGALTRFGRGLCTYYDNTLTLIIDNKLKQYSINTETSAFTETLSIDINTLAGLEARVAALEGA